MKIISSCIFNFVGNIFEGECVDVVRFDVYLVKHNMIGFSHLQPPLKLLAPLLVYSC